MNKKSLLYIFLFVIAIGIYYYYQHQDDENAKEANAITKNIDNQPTYQSNQILTMIYNPTGYLSYKIEGKNVKYFEETGNTLFDNPDITLYRSDSEPTWNINALKAVLTNNRLLYLNNDVLLENRLPDPQLQKIITDNAEVNLITQMVTSKDKVTIQGANFTSSGVGLNGDLKQKTANILEDVKTRYTTTTSINTDFRATE